jgi:hypothetical protein
MVMAEPQCRIENPEIDVPALAVAAEKLRDATERTRNARKLPGATVAAGADRHIPRDLYRLSAEK